MSKSYRLKKISDREFEYIIFSVDYSRIEDYLSELSQELSGKMRSGAVVFDLLLSNGLSSDRYVSAYFDGRIFHRNTIKPVDSVDDKIKKLSSNFYLRKPEILENGILTRAQKFLLKRQLDS